MVSALAMVGGLAAVYNSCQCMQGQIDTLDLHTASKGWWTITLIQFNKVNYQFFLSPDVFDSTIIITAVLDMTTKKRDKSTVVRQNENFAN